MDFRQNAPSFPALVEGRFDAPCTFLSDDLPEAVSVSDRVGAARHSSAYVPFQSNAPEMVCSLDADAALGGPHR